MKENYVYSNGRVLIYDDNHYEEILEREYQDNIDKILETENIIELLVKEKENYIESIEIKKSNIKHNKKNNQNIVVMSIIVGAIIMFGDLLVNPIYFMQGIRWWIGIFASSTFLALTAPVLLKNLNEIKELKNDIKGINLSSKILEKELIKHQKLLINLKSIKTKENEKKETNEIKKINLEKLKELKRLLALYCSIGSNEKLFKDYYENGLLESKLNNDFNAEEINEIKKYFKTK